MPEVNHPPDADRFAPAAAVELIDHQLLLTRGDRYEADKVLRYLHAEDGFELQLLDLEAYVDGAGLLHLRLDYTCFYEGADTRSGAAVMTYQGRFTVWWDG